MDYFLVIFICIIFLWLFIIFKFSKKRKIDSKEKEKILKNFNNIKKLSSNKEKIIDYDKLYHKILLDLWYSWSFWEILKREPKIIKDINKIWELHKLRNKLVHDFDLLTENILKKKAEEYKNIIEILLKEI